MDAREILTSIAISSAPHMENKDRGNFVEAITRKATHPLDLDLLETEGSEYSNNQLRSLFGN